MAGVSAPTHLAAVVQNARLLRERGDLVGARTVLAQAIEVAGSAYGPDHPDVLHTARLLASVHRELGELTAARRTVEEALAAGQLSLAEDHPAMLLLTYDLGLVADELGNRHEARRNLGTVVRLGPAALGEAHPAVQAAAAYLAPPGEGGEARPPAAEPQWAPPPLPQSPVPPARPPRISSAPAYHRLRSRRTPMLVIGVVAALALVAALVTVVMVVNPGGSGPPRAAPTTASAGAVAPQRPAPTGVRLRDEGGTITLTWEDQSGGTTPFIVSVARAGEQARPFANLPVGRTSYTVNGLNPRLEYCFTVVAVYSTENFAVSELVCTKRTPPSGTPSSSRR